MATIQEFRSSFVGDLAKPARFDVRIAKLPNGVKSAGITSETLSLRCEGAELPGRSFAIAENKIYGTVDRYAYQAVYNDLTLNFIVSDTMQERFVFDMWMEQIQDSNTWNFNYKNNYISDIIITQYDNANRKVYDITLKDAFPSNVNQLGLDWANADGYHKLDVTFSYDYWDAKLYTQNIPGSGPNKASMFNIGQILTAAGATQTVGKALDSKNPYAILGAIGQLGSMAPTFGSQQTVSNVINTQGQGALDSLNDKAASAVNAIKNGIGSLF
jgi:hypothetical protein